MNPKNIKEISFWIAIVGGLNWGLVGLGNVLGAGNWNAVHFALASVHGADDFIYIIFGAATFYLLWTKISK